MKSQELCCALRLLLLFSTLGIQLSTSAQGTAITYQGQLKDNSGPGTGLYDFTFTLFSASSGGSAVAGPSTNSPTGVTNGVFTVTLDFGADVFNGTDRWLEIGVRPYEGSAFTILSPRQKLTSTPYAITASNLTGTASAATNFTGLLAGDVIGTQGATVVWSVGGQSAANVASGASAANAATSANLPNAIVKRDATGNFSAGAITAASVSGDGSGLTSLNASQLTSGTVNDARLSSNAALLNGKHVFTDSNTFSGVVRATHTNNQFGGAFTGTVAGNGTGLSNLAAAQLTGTISSNNIGAGSITRIMLAAGAVGSNQLASAAVTTATLATGAVKADKMATIVAPVPLMRFTNPTPETFDRFGGAMAMVGNERVLIGAENDNTGASRAGAAYLFSTNGTLLTTFTNPTPGISDSFGFSVAAAGSGHLLISAYQDDTGATNAGAAYLFSTNGALLTTFTNPTPALDDQFGHTLAFVGIDHVLIGAPRDDTGATNAGAAYLFSTNGTLLATVTNPTPALNELFGFSLAAVGNERMVISAYQADAGGIDAGTAYLFSINGALLLTFENPTPEVIDLFGFSVAAMGDDRVLINALFDNDGAGTAYLFSTNGALLTTFTNPTPVINDHFGRTLTAVGNDHVLIGATGDDTGTTNAGAAYLFSTNGALLTTFTNLTPTSGGSLGSSLAAVGNNRVLIGAIGDNTGAFGAGAAYLFTLESFTPDLIADRVRAGSITATSLDSTIGVWTRSGDNVFRPAGNVGIGTSNPGYPLDVAGPVRITSVGDGAEILNLGIERSWAFRQLGTGAGTALELASIGGGGNKNFVINTTGRVGIGTTNPLALLHIMGGGEHLRLHDSVRGNYWAIYTEDHPTGADGNLLFVPGPTGVFAFIRKSDGNYFSGSDARLKTDIRGLGSVLDRVLQLQPVSYRMKNASADAPLTLGLIAQEIEPLFPEVVAEHDGMKALNYSGLVPVTVGAIQELNQKLNDELKRRDAENAELKRDVEELKARVNALTHKFTGSPRK